MSATFSRGWLKIWSLAHHDFLFHQIPCSTWVYFGELLEAVRSKVTRTSAAYLETRLISGLKRGGEKSRCFMTPGHLNNCSTLQKCPFRKQALALPYTEIPCTVYNSNYDWFYANAHWSSMLGHQHIWKCIHASVHVDGWMVKERRRRRERQMVFIFKHRPLHLHHSQTYFAFFLQEFSSKKMVWDSE